MIEKKNELLPVGAFFVIIASLFAGHFGVGDVIFPPVLGRDTGSSWLVAAMGYGIINSLGVLVAYLAISRQQKTLLEMSSAALGRWFGVVFTTLCMLIIGPVFILPRVSSATHEMSIMPFFPEFPIWATLLVFFGLNFYVAYNRSQVIDRLGKVLSPILIIFMTVIIVKGIFTPTPELSPCSSQSPLIDGVLNGYNTMNAIGAALFGGWILKELNMRGIKDKDSQTRNLTIIGPFVALALLITSTGLTYLGAAAGNAFSDSQIGVYTVDIAELLLGYTGKVIFAIILAFACFTTSVGLTSTAGDVFQEMTGGRLKYEVIVGLSSLVGFLLGLVGLARIVGYTVPWLMLVYPALIVLLLGGHFYNFNRIKLAVGAGIITAVLFSTGDFLAGLGFQGNFVSSLVAKLPLGTMGMGWLVPTVIVIVIALLFTQAGPKSIDGGRHSVKDR